MATGDRGFYVDLRRASEVQKAIAKLDTQVEKEVNSALSKQGRKIRDEGRSIVPNRPDEATGWGSREPTPRFRLNPDGTWNRGRVSPGWPAWNPGGIKSSIKSTRRAWRLTLTMSDRAGVVYSTAFTKTDGISPQGRGLRSRLSTVNKSRKGARSGRILVPALRKHYRATLDELEAGVRRAAEVIERRINGR